MEIFAKHETIELRKTHVPSCVSLFFKEDPIKVVKGAGQYLYDEKGNRYLDCINNVAHVGHCHPHVVKKTSEQCSLLETNSRYLHDNLVLYSKRISAYMPEPLKMTFYTNSGSESNDLAIRIARKTGNGGYDILVIDHAYHGHLSSLIDISPYKFKNTGGDGQKIHVHVVPVPDSYRGKYRNSEYTDEELCDLYVQEIIDLVEKAEKNGRRICLFLAESLQSCGGQIVYPKNFLKKAYNYLHSKGILCLADEVQCGFYRNGKNMWGFQIYGDDITPDFVTIGKSMGNGHPVSCLVTTSEIATKFSNFGMQYFNTYGGNPVSMAAANAVLDVVENEKLYKHVTEVSTYMLAELDKLKDKHAIIGDVRGYGFFIGIDFVTCRKKRDPATHKARLILNRMKDYYILLSLDGPYDNVMKFKPPLSFNLENAMLLLEKLDHVLIELSQKSLL